MADVNFEVYDHRYDYVEGGFGSVDAAEEFALNWTYENHGKACSVQREVEDYGYPDRRIVSIWVNGEKVFKTHRWDEEEIHI